ncbi:MAG: hypothetical protein K8T25_01475 [Planctomycetia bacterium]|nr:hypothetical protein [Planctomycetia bacterium]
MSALSESMLHQGISIEVLFVDVKPTFGDLFLICGETHPAFPSTGRFGFDRLADLQFEQVDDYFGVRSLTDEGADVPIWLFPIIAGEPVDHHPGPFDGVRLEYNVLRNPLNRSEHYLRCVQEIAVLGAQVEYRSRGLSLGAQSDLTSVRADIAAIADYWQSQGISVGSRQALEVDF